MAEHGQRTLRAGIASAAATGGDVTQCVSSIKGATSPRWSIGIGTGPTWLVLQQSYRGVWQQALSVQIGNTSRTAPVRFNAATYEWLPEAAQRYFHPVRYAGRGNYCRRLESWCPYTGMQSGACHPVTTGVTGSVPFPQLNRTIRPLKNRKPCAPR